MRVPRLVAVVLWLTVAVLAVAGFAAFSPQSTPEPTTTTTTTTLPVRGSATGQVMARALAAGLQSTSATTIEPTDRIVLNSLLSESAPLSPQPLAATTTTTTTTTTAPPVSTLTDPATTSTTDSRGVPLSKEEARSIIALFFKPADVDTALKIAECESTLYPDNVNSLSGASGLFQHLPKYWAKRSAAAGWAGADIFDPYANTAVAAWLRYDAGGWSHWTCYNG